MRISRAAGTITAMAALVLGGCSDDSGRAVPPPTTAVASATAAPPSTDPSTPTADQGSPDTGGMTAAQVCELLTPAEAKRLLTDAGAKVAGVKVSPATTARASCSFADPDGFAGRLDLDAYGELPSTMGTETEVSGHKAYEIGNGPTCALVIEVDAKLALSVIAQVQEAKDLCRTARGAAEKALKRLHR